MASMLSGLERQQQRSIEHAVVDLSSRLTCLPTGHPRRCVLAAMIEVLVVEIRWREVRAAKRE
jgi:hypothetical protein